MKSSFHTSRSVIKGVTLPIMLFMITGISCSLKHNSGTAATSPEPDEGTPRSRIVVEKSEMIEGTEQCTEQEMEEHCREFELKKLKVETGNLQKQQQFYERTAPYRRIDSVFVPFDAQGFPELPAFGNEFSYLQCSSEIHRQDYSSCECIMVLGCDEQEDTYTFTVDYDDWGKFIGVYFNYGTFYSHWISAFGQVGIWDVENERRVQLEQDMLALVRDEDKLGRIAVFVNAMPMKQIGADPERVLEAIDRYWNASFTDWAELERQVNEHDAKIEMSEDYIPHYYHQQTMAGDELAYERGIMLRRWIEAGRGQEANDLIVLYRYYILQGAVKYGYESDLYSMATRVKSDLGNTMTLKHRSFYVSEVDKLMGQMGEASASR